MLDRQPRTPQVGRGREWRIRQWRSPLTLVLIAGINQGLALPLVWAGTVAAQVPSRYTLSQVFEAAPVRVMAGATIPVRHEKEKIIVTPEETAPVTLIVAENLTSQGRVLIPAGSQIEGQLQPAEGGTQFVARSLTLSNTGRKVALDATSKVVTRTQEIDKGTNVRSILTGAAAGAGAAALITLITGHRLNLGVILGGAGLGALGGVLIDGRKKAKVIVVEPVQDLELTLRSPLTL